MKKSITLIMGLAMCATAYAAEEKPNIVLIMADDMNSSVTALGRIVWKYAVKSDRFAVV